MKLTVEDQEILSEMNVPEADFKQIENAADKTVITLGNEDTTGKSISMRTASELLGRKAFLSGLNRSAFHFSAVREIGDGRLVYFDSSKYFKD